MVLCPEPFRTLTVPSICAAPSVVTLLRFTVRAILRVYLMRLAR
jgi:hypothetical protein